jgi:hypothetical protein
MHSFALQNSSAAAIEKTGKKAMRHGKPRRLRGNVGIATTLVAQLWKNREGAGPSPAQFLSR